MSKEDNWLLKQINLVIAGLLEISMDVIKFPLQKM
jgi:hypothetical protein